MKVLGVIPRSKGLVDAMKNPIETNRFMILRNIRKFEAEIKMPTWPCAAFTLQWSNKKQTRKEPMRPKIFFCDAIAHGTADT